MAATVFSRTAGGVHAALIPTKWSGKDFKAAYEANPLVPFMGEDENSIIQVDKDFTKGKGDQMIFNLRALLTGSGQGNDGNYGGNEEALSYLPFTALIAERGHAVKITGKMTEQSAVVNLRDGGRNAMKEWVGRINARDIIDALSGLANQTFAGQRTGAAASGIATITQRAVSKGATATRWFGGGEIAGVVGRVATDSAITAGLVFGPAVVSHLRRMATRTVTSAGAAITPLRPVMIDGRAMFLYIAGPGQMMSFRDNSNWLQAVREAEIRGKSNPIFQHVAAVWDDVMIVECQLINQRYGINGVAQSEAFDATSDVAASGVAIERGLFLGAQAAVMPWGQMPTWSEGYSNPPHNTQWVCHSDMLYGCHKTYFDSLDFGCITCDTAIAPALVA